MRGQIIRGIWALIWAAGISTAASAQTQISPYIEAQQVLDAEFNNGGEVLTYSTLAVGVEGKTSGRRVEAQISYRYEYRIPWKDRLADESVHNGLARARAEVLPNLLSVEGGAIATRTRSDIRGVALSPISANDENLTQIYGIYAGPNLTANAGPLFINGSYRFGYIKAKNNFALTLPTGQVALDRYDQATSHDASLSVGMPSGQLPFGWTVTGGYTRENATQLDQHYTGKYVRGDVTWPVAPHIALTGGVGYEDISVSERAPLRDANGVPILNSRARFITDPNSPRLLSFETSGLIWDVGVIWKPNRRTTIQARGGRRYGSRAITATVDYQLRRTVALRAGVYDAIESFGRALTSGLARLPTSFEVDRNLLVNGFGGCIFGTTPGTGACFDDALQSITTANYRSRGAYVMLSGNRGPWGFGFGGGYTHHKYLAPQISQLFTINGVIDQTAYAEVQAGRELSSTSDIGGTIFAKWDSSGLPNAPDITSFGTTISYQRRFMDRLVGFGSVSAYNSRVQRTGSSSHGIAVIGLRYQF